VGDEVCPAKATTLTRFCIYGIAETFPDGKAMTELSRMDAPKEADDVGREIGECPLVFGGSFHAFDNQNFDGHSRGFQFQPELILKHIAKRQSWQGCS
jgi:hypothetical protein